MTRSDIISQYIRVNRQFEKQYFPKVRKAIRYKKNQVLNKLRAGGIQDAIRFLHADLGNERLTDVVEDLYKQVGLRHARLNYSRMLSETGKKGAIMPLEMKGFGFNQIWTNFIVNYFRQFLLEKITYHVAATTRDALLAILATATTEGWSVDQTVDKVEGWNERYQAARVVRTEVGRAANVGAKANSETLTYEQQKEWVSAHDNRVRGKKPKDHANHVKLDGTKIDADDSFNDSVNGDLLDFPGDIKASAASTINCRCVAVWTAKRDKDGNLIPKRRSTAVSFPGQLRRPETVTI
jgi:hypothetical protein